LPHALDRRGTSLLNLKWAQRQTQMIIGTFRDADDGFVGQLFCMGLEQVPIAVVPSETDRCFAFLIAGKELSTSIEIGRGVYVPAKNGAYLDVKIDGPMLPAPVSATMLLKPTREGIYSLDWKRTNRVNKRKGPKKR